MNKKILTLAIILLIALVGGYYYINRPNSQKNGDITITDNNRVGDDKDANGCIGSAGYSWCQTKNSCIRQWEEYCTATTPKKVVFKCDDSKSIQATFYPGDDKYVDLVLSDSRRLSIPRVMSASGARYANYEESFVFWNKGDTAFITEVLDEKTVKTYGNCNLSQ